jgi:hypothetical protein
MKYFNLSSVHIETHRVKHGVCTLATETSKSDIGGAFTKPRALADYDNQFQQRGQPEYKAMEKQAPLQFLFNNSM